MSVLDSQAHQVTSVMMTNHVKGDMNVQVVTLSRRERMLAHKITDPPLLRALDEVVQDIFEENSSIMFTMM